MRFRVNRKYLFLSLLFFIIEAIIAIYFKQGFIRSVFGDFLVVILLYCLVRTFTHFSVGQAALGVLLFAYFIEFLQWIDILEILGIEKNLFTDLTLGATFYWGDMLAYTLGIAIVFFIEILLRKKK